MMRAFLLVLAACNSPSSERTQIESVTPDFGPLGGGTQITIAGKNFGGHARVFIGGREAPIAIAVDDATIDVVIPPGDRPGPAELVVVDGTGSAIASDAFRYSTEPSIAAVEPRDAVFQQATTVIVTGSGFADEAAGPPMVVVDGTPIETVTVLSDTQLSFVAPMDRPIGKVRLEIANARGSTKKERALRFRPSARDGLLLFPRHGTQFAVFYDPADGTTVEIPRVVGRSMSTVIADGEAELWAVEFNQLGRLDLATQRLEQGVPMQLRIPAMTRIGELVYGIDRNTQRFGTVTLDGDFEPIGPQLPCCGSHGLAFDGTSLFITYRSAGKKYIATIDRTTGELGTPVEIVGISGHVEELRYFAGSFYASFYTTWTTSTLARIDPATGIATIVTTLPRANAMEVFE